MTKKNEKKVEEEKEQVNNEDSKIEDLENQLKRALADYQNLEKRVSEEKVSWIKLANKDLLLRLLPGLDSLELAEKHTKDDGVKLSIKHFLDILEEIGVKRIETIGSDFDPRFMEAVSAVEGEEGKVAQELRAGYTLNGQVLRAAQVTVGKSLAN